MRLILEVRSGPAAGRTVTVTPDQPFYVGRTETAFLAIPNDRKMAPSHFVLESTKEGCWVRDLSTRFGTFVNGERVTRSALKPGDVILAGESEFLVGLEQAGAPEPPKPAEAPVPVSTAAIPAPPQTATPPPAPVSEPPTEAPVSFDPQLTAEFAARFHGEGVSVDDAAKLLTDAVTLGDAAATWPQRRAIEGHLDHLLTVRKAQELAPLNKGSKTDWLAGEPATPMLWVILSVVKGRLMAARQKEEEEAAKPAE